MNWNLYSIFDIGNGTHYNKITILLFSSKILGVVTVGRIMARIVGGHVTTDSCITEIMYKSFTKVNNNLAVRTSVLHRLEIICDAVRRLVYVPQPDEIFPQRIGIFACKEVVLFNLQIK